MISPSVIDAMPDGLHLYHIPGSRVFALECACPGAHPIYSRRYVRKHPEEFRYASADEIAAFISADSDYDHT